VTAPVIFAALLFWAAVFAVYLTMQGTTPLEFLLGRFEPLPADLGTWRELGPNAQTGLVCEERLLLPNGQSSSRWLVHQVRHRDPVTRAIVEVEPERRVRRRRVSVR
jgi:hypothetical protein